MVRALSLLLLLAACGDNADKPATPAESRLTAKAVSDVDAAMADARRAAPAALPQPAPSATGAN